MVAAQNGDVEVTYADTSLLSKNVGYISKYNLETGIQIFMKWFKNYHNYE
jgi:UDP-glucuronate 4-epimerase